MPDHINISITGAGRLGISLALKFLHSKKNVFKLTAISSRSEKSLNGAKEILGGLAKDVLITSNNTEAFKKADIFLICTPDDTIQSVCEEMVKYFTGIKGREPRALKKTAIHFSGSKTLDVLSSAKKNNYTTICMHPLKSFADPKEAYKTIKGTLFGVTYDKEDNMAEKTTALFLSEFEGKSIFVENSKKALYHASACIASNYLVSLLDYTSLIAQSMGAVPQDFLEGLLALSEGTMENIKKMGTKKALTGPIARGDTATIREHVEIIKKNLPPDVLEMYSLMGSKTAEISLSNKWIDKNIYNEFIRIFKERD